MDDRRALGQRGERAAATYLVAHGLTVLTTNWRPGGGELAGEIDIIAQDGPTWVFVEVRTRRGNTPGRAEESVTPAKGARLIALAGAYLQAHHPTPDRADWRIDVVAIWVRHDGTARLHWLRGAVEEP